MNDKITEMHIFDDNALFFFANIKNSVKYEIPIYQRAFAWTEKEIVQLINDIYDIDNSTENYYLGSLIVAKKENTFEVIDGQQRLTTLFIILKSLGCKIKNNLTFSCRKKSNYTLKNLTSLESLSDEEYKEKVENNIRCGRDIAISEFNRPDFDKAKFVNNLKKVIIYRIEVPKNTDLNRYFEIMNTRGEQLEQHHILKATLMSHLNGEKDKSWFSKIWDACSDMTGYVQMHFNTKDRETLFGTDWRFLNTCQLSELTLEKSGKNDRSCKIEDIIKDDFCVLSPDGVDENDKRIRFNSIIEFPHFLLHALKVFVSTQNIDVQLDEQLDDKKLCSSFSKVFGGNDKEKLSADFIVFLLKCRYLFDKYILKREFANDDFDGEWSLKELKKSKTKNTPSYITTDLGNKKEKDRTRTERAKRILMLQACFRVSYTSPKVMHWITTLLKWLTVDKNLKNLKSYEAVTEQIAKTAVYEGFLKDKKFNSGVSTPHIVFNYLDYLLWRNEPNASFTFEFRNSVEHWYPQNPSKDTFDYWENVDFFGNLCIIQREINSKFSNLDPVSKKQTFDEMIKKGSLKLRKMADKTTNKYTWRDSVCAEHGNEMIALLENACQN